MRGHVPAPPGDGCSTEGGSGGWARGNAVPGNNGDDGDVLPARHRLLKRLRPVTWLDVLFCSTYENAA